jgi:hypothetical protein
LLITKLGIWHDTLLINKNAIIKKNRQFLNHFLKTLIKFCVKKWFFWGKIDKIVKIYLDDSYKRANHDQQITLLPACQYDP